MAGRIVVFGATGYTGALTAKALVERGVKPVLAGRSKDKLDEAASRLGGGLETAVADVGRAESVHQLVGEGDVLISTVGPFATWGYPALAAAVQNKAHYLDSTGEPGFIRDVFETWGPRAEQAGAGLITAMGYEYAPGNLAGALALRDAGPDATGLQVGYFAVGPLDPRGVSGGTFASLTGSLFEDGYALKDGMLVSERAGLRYRRFTAAGKRRPGLTLGGSEHFTMPLIHPGLRDVDTYLGWFGFATPFTSVMSATGGRIVALPPIKKVVNKGLERVFRSRGTGPSEAMRQRFRSVVVAEATNAAGETIARAAVEGTNPYDFTARNLAWGATAMADGKLRGAGAMGPADAFGLDVFEAGMAEIGITRTE